MFKYVVIFILGLATYPALSQIKYFDGGLMGGFDVSQIDGDFLGGYNKAGLILGGFVSRDLSHRMKGRLELKYIQKGKVKPFDPESGDESYLKVRLNYIQLPLMAEYMLNNQFSVDAGIGLGYLLSSGIYDEYGKFSEEDAPNKFYQSEVAFMFGANYYINARWRANIRWAYSVFAIADLLDEDIQGIYVWQNPGRQFNRTIEFTMCYSIGK